MVVINILKNPIILLIFIVTTLKNCRNIKNIKSAIHFNPFYDCIRFQYTFVPRIFAHVCVHQSQKHPIYMIHYELVNMN